MSSVPVTSSSFVPRRASRWRRLAERVRAYPMFAQLWTERLTRPGRYLVTGAIATGIAGSLPEDMIGSFAFSFFASLLLLSMMISLTLRPRVTVRRIAPRRCMAGSSVTVTYKITSTSKRTQFDVGAYEFRLPRRLKMLSEPMYVESLGPGESASFEHELRADRRGSYTLRGPTAVTSFPFGITHGKRFAPQSARLIVHPAFKTLRRIAMPLGARYQPGGIALASRLGDSMEFVGNREYQPGDRVRDLHPRSWARIGHPVVRQYQEEYLTRVAMLVDTYTPRLAGGRELEAVLSLAAAVADYLARSEHIVDIFAAGPELYHFQSGRSLGYLDEVLDILACIERCTSDPFGAIAPEFARQVGQTSAVIALLLDFDDARRAMIEQIAASGVSVRAVVVTRDRATAGRAAASGCIVLSAEQVEAGVDSL